MSFVPSQQRTAQLCRDSDRSKGRLPSSHTPRPPFPPTARHWLPHEQQNPPAHQMGVIDGDSLAGRRCVVCAPTCGGKGGIEESVSILGKASWWSRLSESRHRVRSLASIHSQPAHNARNHPSSGAGGTVVEAHQVRRLPLSLALPPIIPLSPSLPGLRSVDPSTSPQLHLYSCGRPSPQS